MLFRSVDPLAGSYFVESLTQEVENAAWKLMETIDGMGGSVSAIESGYIQDEIARSAYEYQKSIEDNSKIIVGVNSFQNNNEEKIPGFRIDDSIRQMQSSQLSKLKAKRNNEIVKSNLEALGKAASGKDNIMPFVLTCVESYCTLGEIADTLRKVYGEYK